MTMFGVTTICVDAVRRALEARGFDCLVFHATGTGGRAMDKLVEAGLIRGVLDITTTEVADEVVGGVFPAGPDRFDGDSGCWRALRHELRRTRHGEFWRSQYGSRTVSESPTERYVTNQ